MKNKLLFIIIILSLLSVYSVTAYNEYAYWKMNEGSGTTVNDEIGSNDLTLNDGLGFNNTYPSFNISGSGSGYSIKFDGVNDDATDGDIDTISTGMSFSLWIKTSTTPSGRFIISKYLGSYDYGIYLEDATSIRFFEQTNDLITGFSNFASNQWIHLVFTHRDISTTSEWCAYQNTILRGCVNVTGGSMNNNALTFGARDTSDASFAYTGLMDEVIIFNSTLNINEIRNLYNYGDIEGVGVTYFKVYANDSFNNQSINNFSATINGSDYSTTSGEITSSIETGTGNVDVLIFNAYINTGTLENKTYNSYDTNNNLYASLDRLAPFNPEIIVNEENIFQGNTTITNNETWIFDFNFTDDEILYYYFVNVTDENGTNINISQGALSGTNQRINYTINASEITINQTINVNVMVSDAHTEKIIPNYKITNKKSSITFKTQNDNNIKIETRAQSDITANKELDRYKFTVVFDDGLTAQRIFDVKTDKCKIDYIENSDYPAHFVSYCDGTGNWIDFSGGQVSSVNKLDDYHYEVIMIDVPPMITFNSIGGVNIISEDYHFYYGTAYSPPSFDLFTSFPNTTNNILILGLILIVLLTLGITSMWNKLTLVFYTVNILTMILALFLMVNGWVMIFGIILFVLPATFIFSYKEE